MSAPTGEIYRIDWLPGTDVLHGTCHCGAEHTAQDPVEMWEWMLGHPEGHRLQPQSQPQSEPQSQPQSPERAP
ncbi:hypothetical protein [Streptomyces hyaluromycini]|uniref:hypothetical protein n=1 Tax=Streptomyces hyaluromycini TaxID=1377993 RepID=UPI000B5C9B38|nr:hypothetical protein [Streptomyces hyaluromycini]